MARSPLRLEEDRSREPSRFFLVRDIYVRGKKRKVKKFIGNMRPDDRALQEMRFSHGLDLELKAVKKESQLNAEALHADHLDDQMIRDVEEMRSLYHTVWSLMTTDEVEHYEKEFELSYVHGTISIEGNTLSLRDVINLIEHGILPEDRSLREINEVQNFRKVVLFRIKQRGVADLGMIRRLHALIMDNIDLETAGAFRRVDDIGIIGYQGQLTPAALIEDELNEALREYRNRINDGVHPFEAAILFHYTFEIIHPFTDGNGRVGREILNYMLTRQRYPRLLVLGEDRPTYISALQKGNDGETGAMLQLFFDLIMKQRPEVLGKRLEQFTTRRQPET